MYKQIYADRIKDHVSEVCPLIENDGIKIFSVGEVIKDRPTVIGLNGQIEHSGHRDDLKNPAKAHGFRPVIKEVNNLFAISNWHNKKSIKKVAPSDIKNIDSRLWKTNDNGKYEYNVAPINAKFIGEKLLDAIHEVKLNQVRIIGHSNGGLAALSTSKDDSIEKVVAMSIPALGSILANIPKLEMMKKHGMLKTRDLIILRALKKIVDFDYGFQHDNANGIADKMDDYANWSKCIWLMGSSNYAKCKTDSDTLKRFLTFEYYGKIATKVITQGFIERNSEYLSDGVVPYNEDEILALSKKYGFEFVKMLNEYAYHLAITDYRLQDYGYSLLLRK